MLAPGKFLEQVAIVKVADPSIAATTTVTGSSIDLQAYKADGVCFMSSYGTAAADNLAKVQVSDDDSAWSDVEGSEAGGGSNEDVVMAATRPPGRYARPSFARGASSTLGDIWAIVYRLKDLPYTGNDVSGTQNAVETVDAAIGTP